MQVSAQQLAAAEARDDDLRFVARVRQGEARQRLVQLLDRADVRVRPLAREPDEVVGLLRERRREQRTPRRERERVRKQPSVARQLPRGARLLRRESPVKKSRPLRVGQFAHERLNLVVTYFQRGTNIKQRRGEDNRGQRGQRGNG